MLIGRSHIEAGHRIVDPGIIDADPFPKFADALQSYVDRYEVRPNTAWMTQSEIENLIAAMPPPVFGAGLLQHSLSRSLDRLETFFTMMGLEVVQI